MATQITPFEDVLEYLDPLWPLLTNPDISEVMVNPDLRVFVEELGIKSEVTGLRIRPENLLAAARRIARHEGVELNAQTPICNARFGDGSSRVCIVIPPVSPDGLALTIRRFRTRSFTAHELIQAGALPESVWSELVSAIAKHRNVLVAGGTGTGKTTFLNLMATLIPAHERIVLLESPPEIQLDHPNKFPLQATEDFSFSAIIKSVVLRLNADRIILGEVRGEEAWDLLRVLNTGHSGSLATVHADSAEEALYTIASLAASAKPNSNSAFIREQVARAIHYVVFLAKLASGKRVVSELIRVSGYESETQKFSTVPLYPEAVSMGGGTVTS